MTTRTPVLPAVLAAALVAGAPVARSAQIVASADGSGARPYLLEARADVLRGRAAAAREGLERAETRLLISGDAGAGAGFRLAQADRNPGVVEVVEARAALAARDRARTLRAIDRALAADLGAAAAAPVPPAPVVALPLAGPAPTPPWSATPLEPVAAPSLSPPAEPPPPLETWMMRPGRWELRGARYLWEGPDRTTRRVEPGRRVPGRWAWRGGEYAWEPARVVTD